MFKEQLTPILYSIFQEREENGTYLNLFYESIIPWHQNQRLYKTKRENSLQIDSPHEYGCNTLDKNL